MSTCDSSDEKQEYSGSVGRGSVQTLSEWSLLPVTINDLLGHFSLTTMPFSLSTSTISGFTIARHRTVLVWPPKT